MRSQTIEVFPTTLKRYDVRDIINQQDVQNMIADIEDLHANHHDLMQIDDLTVPHQCRAVLFHENYSYIQKSHWQKLAQTFVSACDDYNQTVKDFSKHQENLRLTEIRAWFYKSNRELWNKRGCRTYHNHTPCYLSGVFYLHVPGDLLRGGTEFCDPRGAGCRTSNVEFLPVNLTWVIFPGWLEHAAGQADSEEWRYTIAADLFVVI